jgi:signal transduction histidine kinase
VSDASVKCDFRPRARTASVVRATCRAYRPGRARLERHRRRIGGDPYNRRMDSTAASRDRSLRRAPLLLVASGALALVVIALTWSLFADPGGPPRSSNAEPERLPLAGIGLVLIALAAGAAWLVGASLSRWQMADRVREARLEMHALTQLLDVWQWQTDAEHHLVRLQPPQGAPGSAWAGRASGQRLWDRFDVGADDNLRERLASHSILLDVAATQSAGTRWLLRGVPRFDGHGSFVGYIGTARALSNDDATTSAAASAVDAGDAEAFSYTVTHDLRAPLRVIDGFARILKEDYAGVLDRIGNDHLDRVLAAAARMNGMIDALLALARLSSQPLARQPVNLSQLAHYIVDDLRRSHPEREVELRIQPDLETAGDPTLLRLVLENLLGNAWKYSAQAHQARLCFERCEQRGRSAYVVRDNGAGFDMRFADRLFGAFQRLHSASDFPGTGIGLASVRRIVRRHGGEVWADAEVGKGANFYFTLDERN